jgi:hypothetical protein
VLSWADAQKWQELCDALGAEEIAGLFRTWWKRIVLPLRPEERAAGYDGSLCSWQRAVSLTRSFDRPWRGRELFEEIIPDNRDRGRPDRAQLLFDRVVTKKTPGQFRPRVIQEGVPPSRHIHDQHFDRKPDGKEGRGCRTEGTVRNRQDLGVNKGLSHLPYWQKIGRAIHRRLREVERVSHNSGLRGDSLQRLVPPSGTDDAEKAPALPFGPPRVMALWGALTLFPRLIDGLHNPDLRTRIVDLWGLTSNEQRAHGQPDELPSAAAAPQGVDLPSAENAALRLDPAWLEDRPSIHWSGSTGMPSSSRDIHQQRRPIAIPASGFRGPRRCTTRPMD